MSKDIVVFGEFVAPDLLVAEAAKERSFEVVVLSCWPEILSHLPYSLLPYAKIINRVLPVERWDSPTHIRAVIAREFPGRAAIWYTSLDEVSQTIAALRQADGLPTSAPEVITYCLNKAALRHDLFRKGMSRVIAVRGNDVLRIATGAVPWPFEGPGFLQTAFGTGGVGTRKVADATELCRSMQVLRSPLGDPPYLDQFIHSSDEFVLTQAAEGNLYSLEAVIVRGNLYPLGFSRSYFLEAPIEEGTDLKPMPRLVHPVIPPNADSITMELERRVVADGYTDGFLHIEGMIDETGCFEELDRNPRTIGAFFLWAMNEVWGVSMGDLILDWVLGEFATAKLPSRPRKAACLQKFLGPIGGGMLRDVKMPDSPAVPWTIQRLAPGAILPANPTSGRWVAGYLTVAATIEESEAASRELRKQVRINGAPATF